MALRSRTEVGYLADQLERSFRGGAWHGPSTWEAVVDIDAATAGRRPRGAPHTIMALVAHITFWMDAARRRISGEGDVDASLDWPKEEQPTADAWSRAIAELERAHDGLRSAIGELDDRRLDDAVPGSDPTVRGLLYGTLQHNAYHTGQIVQMTRELSR
jgi:uncharacterized damage-inducible protein DinB